MVRDQSGVLNLWNDSDALTQRVADHGNGRAKWEDM